MSWRSKEPLLMLLQCVTAAIDCSHKWATVQVLIICRHVLLLSIDAVEKVAWKRAVVRVNGRMEARSSVCALKSCCAMAGVRRACCGKDISLEI